LKAATVISAMMLMSASVSLLIMIAGFLEVMFLFQTNNLLFVKFIVSYQHFDSEKKNYQLRCELAIVTFLGGTASTDL
jgi:hypothetical protein